MLARAFCGRDQAAAVPDCGSGPESGDAVDLLKSQPFSTKASLEGDAGAGWEPARPVERVMGVRNVGIAGARGFGTLWRPISRRFGAPSPRSRGFDLVGDADKRAGDVARVAGKDNRHQRDQHDGVEAATIVAQRQTSFWSNRLGIVGFMDASCSRFVAMEIARRPSGRSEAVHTAGM